MRSGLRVQFIQKLLDISNGVRMDANLNLIKERFPDWSSAIDPLYRNNASFHSLCGDYLLVVKQIDESYSSDVSISSADLLELKTLLRELEHEMFIYFKEAQTA